MCSSRNLLLYFFIILFQHVSNAQKIPPSPPKQVLHQNRESTNKHKEQVIDSAAFGSARVDSVDDLPGNSYRYVSEGGSKDGWFIKIIPWVLSLIVIYLTLRSIKRDKLYRNTAFISEVDKMFITEPELWSMYDSYREKYESVLIVEGNNTLKIMGKEKIEVAGAATLVIAGNGKLKIAGEAIVVPKNGHAVHVKDEHGFENLDGLQVQIAQNKNAKLEFEALKNVIQVNCKDEGNCKIELQTTRDKRVEGKIEAFAYYHFNNFDTIVKHLPKVSYYYDEWENFIIYVLRESKMFREILLDQSKRYIYDKNYITLLNRLYGSAKKIARVEGKPLDKVVLTEKEKKRLSKPNGIEKEIRRILRRKSWISWIINIPLLRWRFRYRYYISIGCIVTGFILICLYWKAVLHFLNLQ